MIKERKAKAMYEVKSIIENLKETDRIKDTLIFIKRFESLKAEKAEKLKKELFALDIIKLKESDIIKIVDIIPENAIELNKITIEANLDADETNKILNTIKSNK